ncbi:MAG: mechanosensitive ion channel domain-containing protein [Pseudomonadota bacterium]|nr:mechanosensitive ion channel domain-containing protein [Pseudomonadota bacterium]
MQQPSETPSPQDLPPAEASPGEGPPGGDGSALDDLFNTGEITERGARWLDWLRENVLTLDVGVQAAILFAALLPAAIFGPQLKKLIVGQIASRAPEGVFRRAANAFAHIATPIALLVILQIGVITLASLGRPSALVQAGVSLLTAWIVIRLVTLVIRSPFWSQVAFYVAWPIAALDAFGVLGRVLAELDALAFPIGMDENKQPITYSALDFLRTVIVFAALFWIANLLGRFVKGRISAIDELTASFKALLAKILDVLLPVVALVLALQIVGFPFGTLAVFGGAVGLGIGLGLQRTASNFFAGFSLIADKSIKPGDVIEIGDTFGWVTQMNARYVSVRTRDGTEHLVPNDKFIQEGVVNWSHSDRIVRLHAGFGVSYKTRDLRGVKKLAEETAASVDRVLKSPAPVCNLTEFADSSVNFDLRFWISDPANGISNVRSAVMLELWDRLHEAGVEIPFPQLDLHLKSAPESVTKTPND